MKRRPWYTQYGDLADRVRCLKSQFTIRCEDMGVLPRVVSGEVWQDIAARAVFESNWQEGIFVEQGKTKELALHAFEDIDRISGPHVDIGMLVEHHKRHIVALKRKKYPMEEIGAYNLSAAHSAVMWIGNDLTKREMASAMVFFRYVRDLVQNGKLEVSPVLQEDAQRACEVFDKHLADTSHPWAPITDGYFTEGQVFRDLVDLPIEDLVDPMRVEYVHFLHRIVLMGIADPRKCGTFRKTPVHVGDPDVLFPPPSLIPEMMSGFIREFPKLLPHTVEYDSVLKAAEASYRFARIHPYHDGNGRVSRLLMNLVLWGHHPPVYLKADKKGSHRYIQSLKRANRGNLEPLGCLIAMALTEIYQKLIDAVAERPTGF